MPLVGLSFLFAYQALVDNRRTDWLALGLTLGLLLLATYAGLILIALMALFVAATARGRGRLGVIGPWGALAIIVVLNAPHLYWLLRAGLSPAAHLGALPSLLVADKRLAVWANLLLVLLVGHAGLVVLMLVAGGLFEGRRTAAPAIEREPIDPFARNFVFFFAIIPAFVATLIAVLFGLPAPVGSAGPLVVLSGLAVIVAAGDVIRLYRQRTAALVWLGLLVVPPAAIVAATVTLPWTAAVDLEVSKPADAMGQFFTETFRRRTGKALAIVIGDARTAGLVAFASPDRPSLYIDGAPERAPWISDAAVREKGAVVTWTATDNAGTPPAALKARFPDMVAEVPRTFDRSVQGRLALLRIGWAVIRPK
jgi:hypothetical protein